MKICISFIFLLFLYGSVNASDIGYAFVSDDIREAVFRFKFSSNTTAKKKGVDRFFLRIENGDPSDKFMTRFHGESLVAPWSKSEQKGPRLGEVSHKSLGGLGVVFSVGAIEWINDNKVKVPWGVFAAGLNAAGGVVVVELQEGQWVVTLNHRYWVS